MAIYTPIPVDPSWAPDRFAAEVTDRQFRALAERLDASAVLQEVSGLSRIGSPRRSPSADPALVRRWLTNAWNTERVLGLSGRMLEGAGGAALQWSFPQAYYAAFAQVLAFFQVAGFTETKHGSVQKRFAELAMAGEYPASMTFAASGPPHSFSTVGLDPTPHDYSSAHYVKGDPGIVDWHIDTFLRTTRKISLEQRKASTNWKTKTGKRLERYSKDHWRRLSENQGPTALLCLLYRKRIKSNYRDIDTFTADGFDPTEIFRSLERVVAAVAFTHEAFIAAAMGWSWFTDLATDHTAATQCDGLQRRLPHLEALVTSGAS